MGAKIADFSGYATKAGLKCSDGRTIMKDAFASDDNATVPLVWQHGHSNPENVLGHARLENRDDGVYAYAYFNDSAPGQQAKALVEHGDITFLSIYANGLVERAKQVFHGTIREVSLVLAGANPGARIDNVNIAHSDGSIDELEDEVTITTGLAIEHADASADSTDDESVQDILDTFTEKQLNVLEYVAGAAVQAKLDELAAVTHSAVAEGEPDADAEADADADAQQDDGDSAGEQDTESDADGEQENDNNSEGDLNHKEGTTDMGRNVFDQNGADTSEGKKTSLTHSQLETIVTDAQKMGSFKESFLLHAGDYGIDDIDILFPDAKNVTNQPELIARRTEWVAKVLDGAKHSPFARIKSLAADLTADEARAKGYVKGNLKKEEVIKLLKRVTIPTTVYKKQKLDRDDIVDITDLDVVAWLKWEMKFMLEEEIARAILIGDGREADDDDKIDEEKLRPIAWDDDMYAHKLNLATNVSPADIVEGIIRARKNYKGVGTPSLYTTDDILVDLLLIKDKMDRYVYNTEAELASKLRVKEIVVVEVMDTVPDLLGIIVNMADYTIGADKGGALSFFDDFDIDYNQQKYLLETRISGALTKPKSAVVVKRVSGTTVTPTAPTYNPTTHVITIPTVTGVNYQIGGVNKTGAQTITSTTDVEAVPAAGYNFPHNLDTDWTFVYTP